MSLGTADTPFVSFSCRDEEDESQAKLLRRREKKGVRLAADGAVPNDLAGIINPVRLPQHPTAVSWNKPVQVLHPAAVSRNKGMIFVSTRSREAYYGTAVVNRQAPRT